MTVAEYVKEAGYGAIAALVRRSGLSGPTVAKAMRGEPISPTKAKALSEATGGAVSAIELAGLS